MKKVMIIDDDQQFLDEVVDALSSEGYAVSSFSDGKNASKHAREIIPDIIMLDLQLEDMSGFKVAEELRGLSEEKSIPIVAITGVYTDKEHRLFMDMCGIETCLTKPIDMEEMIRTIERVS